MTWIGGYIGRSNTRPILILTQIFIVKVVFLVQYLLCSINLVYDKRTVGIYRKVGGLSSYLIMAD